MSSLMLLHDLLQDAGLLGGREAIVHAERSHTYGDLARAVEALAGRLAAAGVARGDRVATYLPKSFEECAAIFAISRADAVFVPVNPSLKPAQVRAHPRRLRRPRPAELGAHAEQARRGPR